MADLDWHPAPPALTIPEPAEVIKRAEQIAASLIARQQETEERSYYAPDTHEAFRAAGFYRILVPRRYGGYELGVDTFLRVVMTLARGCPSTGWMYCLGAAHALAVATLFGEAAQEELFRDPDFICPATVAPSGTATRAGDRWIIDGTWKYCSGAPYATHFIGHTLVDEDGAAEPVPMLFVVPRSQWRRLDDWGRQLGLRGSGSHSIVAEHAEIPDCFTIRPAHLGNITVTAAMPGRVLHRNPQYGGGTLSFMFLELCTLAVGIAQGALDAFEDLMRERSTFFPPIVPRTQNLDYQVWYGDAAGKIATAEAALSTAIGEWDRMCSGDPAAFTREREMRIAGITREVIRLCWQAVEGNLFPTAGSSALLHGERLERVWRDLSMVQAHAATGVFLPTLANRALAQIHFTGAEAAFATA
jgi:3-hydroxy-9,10-secoandrosta-1,3,5(10)-triene-9,17-dione monooxygenase